MRVWVHVVGYVALGLITTSYAKDRLPPLKLSCRVPTTVFALDGDGSQTRLTLSHPYGVKYSPIYKGTVTPSLLHELKEKAAVLSKLGDEQSFEWPREKCKITSSWIFECNDGEETKVENMMVKPLFIKTMNTTTQDVMGEDTVISFTLGLLINEQLHTVVMDYSAEKHCHTEIKIP